MHVITERSAIQFVYPFLFEAETFRERAAAFDKAEWERPEKGEKKSLRVWKKDELTAGDLLPQVLHYLEPPAAEGNACNVRVWDMDGNAFQSPDGFGNGKKGKETTWYLNAPSQATSKDIPFRFASVPRLILWHTGIGFVILNVQSAANQSDEWLNLLHYFRFVGPGSRGKKGIRAERQTDDGKTEPFFPRPAGGPPSGAERRCTSALLEALLRAGVLTRDGQPRWWQDAFVPEQLLPFACFLAEEHGVEQRKLDDLLYQLHNFFHCQQELRPTAEDLPPQHRGFLHYAEGCWFMVSLDGGAYCSVNRAEKFFRAEMPSHVAGDYCTLFLLALHQRFALNSITDQVSEALKAEQEEEREERCLGIYRRLLEFNARGYFPQAAQRDHHHRFYEKCQEQFQVERLHREVNDELERLHDYVVMQQEKREEVREKRLEYLLAILATVIGIPSLICGFLGINIPGLTAPGEEGIPLRYALLIAGLPALLAATAIGVLWLYWRRKPRKG